MKLPKKSNDLRREVRPTIVISQVEKIKIGEYRVFKVEPKNKKEIKLPLK